MPSTDPIDRKEGCPSPALLEAFSLGRLPEEQFQDVAVHLATCLTCLDHLGRLGLESDSLVATLRHHLHSRTTGTGAGSTVPSEGQTALDLAPLPFRLGGYELREVLGRGGMGIVYKAQQDRPHRFVAIKMVAPGVVAGERMLSRFRQEVEAVGALQHPNIVHVHDYGEINGRPYFVMEYLAGGSLSQRIKGAALAPRAAAELVAVVARAVQAAHDNGIVHRDLKPGNILLTADGIPKLGDFGLAVFLEEEARLTVTGEVLGTPAYMAPEQTAGEKSVTVRTDVYALGAILYETLTNQPPFKGPTPLATLDLVRKQAPLSPSQVRPEVEGALDAICLKCLEKDPARRYASAAEVAEDLTCWLEGKRLPHTRVPGPAERVLRRYRAAVFLVLAGALFTVLSLTVAWVFDPDRPLRALESRLDRGESVVLIGETGAPAWSRWILEEKSRAAPGADRYFAIHTWSLALLELLRDPRFEHFRLRAWVRHEKSDLGEVGLYVCRSESRDGDARAQGFIQIAFNDVQETKPPPLPAGVKIPIPQPKGNQVMLIPRIWSRLGAESPYEDRLSGPTPELFQAAGFAGGDWRRLTLEVRPESVRGYWGPDDVVVGELRTNTAPPKPHRDDLPRVLVPLVLKVRPMPARGGVGLYVMKGSASFKMVEIEPLPE